MKNIAWNLILFVSISGCILVNNNPLNKNLLELWNYKTLSSINSQISSAEDETLKKRLQNNFTATKHFLYDNIGVGNGKENKSIRMKFLEKISSLNMENKRFYILEYVDGGEKAVIRNILILNATNSSRITSFEYFGDEWHRLKDTTVTKIDLHSEIIKKESFIGGNGTSILYVIASEFNSNKIDSRYYLGDMLSKQEVFFDLLYL